MTFVVLIVTRFCFNSSFFYLKYNDDVTFSISNYANFGWTFTFHLCKSRICERFRFEWSGNFYLAKANTWHESMSELEKSCASHLNSFHITLVASRKIENKTHISKNRILHHSQFKVESYYFYAWIFVCDFFLLHREIANDAIKFHK